MFKRSIHEMVVTAICATLLGLIIDVQLNSWMVKGQDPAEPCDLMPSSDKGPAYYRRLTPWGKWLEMPCPPKTVFVAKWCRCDYPEMEDILTEAHKESKTTTLEPTTKRPTTLPTTAPKTTVPKTTTPTSVKRTSTVPTTPTRTTTVKPTTAKTTTTVKTTTEKTTTKTPQTTTSAITKKTTTTVPTTKLSTTAASTSKTTALPSTTTPKTTTITTVAPTVTKQTTIEPTKPASTNLPLTSSAKEPSDAHHHYSTVKPVIQDSTTLSEVVYPISTPVSPSTAGSNGPAVGDHGHDHGGHSLELSTKQTTAELSPSPTKGVAAVNTTLAPNTMTNSIIVTTHGANSGNHPHNEPTMHNHTETMTSTTMTPSTKNPTSETTRTHSTTESSSTATACEFQEIADDKISYMGFINADIGWIRFQCPHHQEFSLASCGCFNPQEETTPYASTISRTTVGIPQGCPYVKEGRKAFREFIDVLKTWVFSECGENYEFSQLKCGCVLEGTSPDGDAFDLVKTTVSPIVTSPALTSTEEVPPGCPYIAVSRSSFREFVPDIQSWVYSDCSPDHVFKQGACRCEPETIAINGCPFIAVDKSSFKEYIDVLGEWVTSDCPNNYMYSAKQCKCILQDCKHEAFGLASFRTYIEEIKDWVISDCPKNHIFMPSLCKCVSEAGGQTAVQITDHVVGPVVTSTSYPVSTESLSLVTTANCKAVATIGGYKRFIQEVGGWVTYDCPIHTEFNVQICSCQRAGCKYVPDQTGYKEFVDLLGTWIFYDCPIGTSFQTSSCKCDKESAKPPSTTPGPTQSDHHDGGHPGDSDKISTGCLKVQKNNGYMEFLATLGDWVYYDCPVHHAFSEDDCTCVLTGTQTGQDGKTTGCAFSSTGDGTYRQFVDEVSQWVSYDCPAGQVFDNGLCKCRGKDYHPSHDDQVTTVAPQQSTAAPSCSMKTSDMGQDYFLMFVEGHGEILYQCDFGFVFNQTQCGCVKEAPKPTTPKTTYITPGCPLMPSPLGEQYFRMQVGIMGLIDFACPVQQKYVYEKCMCSY